MMQADSNKLFGWLLAALALAISLYFKLSLIHIGAPYTTIDDNTLFNAGFLVWFGEAPPQRMYLESWLVGITSIFTYCQHLIASGDTSLLGLNLIADAYRDFEKNSNDYVYNYRYLMLAFDLLTAFFIYRLSQLFFNKTHSHSWLVFIPASLYLLTSNTLWCNLVARPDTVTAFFSVIGIYAYFLSAQGSKTTSLVWSAIFLGCATGFKLHAALFVVAITLDLIRIHGLKQAFNRVLIFGGIAVFLFCVVAGSPLFDPLLYVKLRALNIRDDASPWIKQGAQLLVVLKASGWLIIPLMLGAIFIIAKKWRNTEKQLKSLFLISMTFLLLFCSLRVLRGYWMLPALPLFFVMASYALGQIKQAKIAAAMALMLLAIPAAQTYQQAKHFKAARYNELQNWIKANVNAEDKIYIIGYDTLFLPKNTSALSVQKQLIETGLNTAILEGENFTSRHIRLWEERAALLLIDMLNAKSNNGFEYYALNSAPLADLEKFVSYQELDYLLIMKNISGPEVEDLLTQVHQDFTKIAEANSPGGKSGTGGLAFEIYARNNHVQ